MQIPISIGNIKMGFTNLNCENENLETLKAVQGKSSDSRRRMKPAGTFLRRGATSTVVYRLSRSTKVETRRKMEQLPTERKPEKQGRDETPPDATEGHHLERKPEKK
ncbi:hypothetical protein YC2023_069473 [Brassica napus]